jgi:hypothetical protein
MKPTISDWAAFLHQQGPFDWAVTMNLKKRHPYYQTHITPQIFEQTGRHYLSLVNKGLFKRQYRYGHTKLNGIFCMELGGIDGYWCVNQQTSGGNICVQSSNACS